RRRPRLAAVQPHQREGAVAHDVSRLERGREALEGRRAGTGAGSAAKGQGGGRGEAGDAQEAPPGGGHNLLPPLRPDRAREVPLESDRLRAVDGVVVPEGSPLFETLAALARDARLVFFAGLPGTGKSLLIHQLAHLAHGG